MTYTQLRRPPITWEILPEDFILPDDPRQNLSKNVIQNNY